MATEETAFFSLAVEGADDFDLATLANSARDLHKLFSILTAREASGRSAHWRVNAPPEFSISASSNGVSATSLHSVVSDSYTAALAATDESPLAWPESFRPEERKLMRKLVNRLRSEAPVHMEASAHEPVTIAPASRGTKRPQPIFASWGTVDGELTTISSEGSLQMRLTEVGTGVAVRCHLPRELLSLSFTLFEQLVRVHGYIYYRSNGRPSTVTDVSSVEQLDAPARELTDFLGALPGITDGISAGEFVRRLRAGGDA